jgi:hypothetical protein
VTWLPCKNRRTVVVIAKFVAGKGQADEAGGNVMRLDAAHVQLLLLCAVLAARVMGEQMTIPDHVAANRGRPVTLPVIRDIRPLPISTLARADLIVYGKLIHLKSYMNDAKTDIYTDYQIIPDRVLVDRSATGAKRPGQAPPRIVTLYGGEITVNGTPVKVVDTSLSRWTEGANLLLFLGRTDDEDRYRLYGDDAGIFEIDSAGNVSSLLKHPEKDKELRGRTAQEVIQAVLDASRR